MSTIDSQISPDFTAAKLFSENSQNVFTLEDISTGKAPRFTLFLEKDELEKYTFSSNIKEKLQPTIDAFETYSNVTPKGSASAYCRALEAISAFPSKVESNLVPTGSILKAIDTEDEWSEPIASAAGNMVTTLTQIRESMLEATKTDAKARRVGSVFFDVLLGTSDKHLELSSMVMAAKAREYTASLGLEEGSEIIFQEDVNWKNLSLDDVRAFSRVLLQSDTDFRWASTNHGIMEARREMLNLWCTHGDDAENEDYKEALQNGLEKALQDGAKGFGISNQSRVALEKFAEANEISEYMPSTIKDYREIMKLADENDDMDVFLTKIRERPAVQKTKNESQSSGSVLMPESLSSFIQDVNEETLPTQMQGLNFLAEDDG